MPTLGGTGRRLVGAPMSDMNQGHEHEFEAALGLPEPLPPGEHVLWQGAPDWRAVGRRCFHARKLVLYFGVILGVRAVTVLSQGGTTGDALIAALWLAPVALAAIAMALLMGWMTARTTVYTITDRRVVMRIGIVLSLTFNLPFRHIEGAGLRKSADGIGDIPLKLAGEDHIAYVHLWPHARPWRFARTEPMLRCVPDATQVAGILSEAWARANEIEVPMASVPARLATPAQPVPAPIARPRPAEPRGLLATR